jgi:hypothetical protein
MSQPIDVTKMDDVSHRSWSELAGMFKKPQFAVVTRYRWHLPFWLGGWYFGKVAYAGTIQITETRDSWTVSHPGLPDGKIEISAFLYNQTPQGYGGVLRIYVNPTKG